MIEMFLICLFVVVATILFCGDMELGWLFTVIVVGVGIFTGFLA